MSQSLAEVARGWEITRAPGDRRVHVRFDARITTEDGEASSKRFVEVVGTDPVDVTFDFRTVTGYDRGARDAWQREVLPLRRQVRSLHFVGTTALTRMGATVFGMVLGIPTSFSEA